MQVSKSRGNENRRNPAGGGQAEKLGWWAGKEGVEKGCRRRSRRRKGLLMISLHTVFLFPSPASSFPKKATMAKRIVVTLNSDNLWLSPFSLPSLRRPPPKFGNTRGLFFFVFNISDLGNSEQWQRPVGRRRRRRRGGAATS